jgi:hypothetical protein
MAACQTPKIIIMITLGEFFSLKRDFGTEKDFGT